MQDLPHEIKKARIDKLILRKEELKKAFVDKNIGSELFVLFEEEKDGCFEGYTENYIRAYLKAQDKPKGLVKVKIISAFKDGGLVEIIKE